MAAMSRPARAEAVRRFAEGVPDFTPGGQFSLGAEEEALLVRRSGRLRRGGAERLVATAAGRPPATGTVVPEIFANQIELNTPVCVDGAAVAHSLGELRGSLAARTAPG